MLATATVAGLGVIGWSYQSRWSYWSCWSFRAVVLELPTKLIWLVRFGCHGVQVADAGAEFAAAAGVA